MDFKDALKPSGRLTVQVWRGGALIEEWTDENLILDAARSAQAALIGGDGEGKTIAQIGFGTNGAAPAPGDDALANAYVKGIGDVSYPEAGVVQFQWTLATSEANGKSIREFGLLCEDGMLFSRKARGVIEKEGDLSLAGTWTITF